MNRWLTLTVFVVWTALAALGGWEWRDRSADLAESRKEAAESRAESQAQSDAREIEHTKAERINAVAGIYEQDKSNADAKQAAVAAALAAGNLKLRRELGALYTAQLSSAAARAVELDAAAQRGAEIAAAAIAVGAECDARDKALRQITIEDRK